MSGSLCNGLVTFPNYSSFLINHLSNFQCCEDIQTFILCHSFGSNETWLESITKNCPIWFQKIWWCPPDLSDKEKLPRPMTALSSSKVTVKDRSGTDRLRQARAKGPLKSKSFCHLRSVHSELQNTGGVLLERFNLPLKSAFKNNTIRSPLPML